jgi:hypothetical protein
MPRTSQSTYLKLLYPLAEGSSIDNTTGGRVKFFVFGRPVTRIPAAIARRIVPLVSQMPGQLGSECPLKDGFR